MRIDSDRNDRNNQDIMVNLLMLMILFGDTVIRTPAGHFDYTEYDSLHRVFEGEVLSGGSRDSISVRVTFVWKGDLSEGQRTDLVSDFRVNLEEGSIALFTADSTGEMLSYGQKRDGLFVMVEWASPNILTLDDLELLSRGVEPTFNEHESIITVHFPMTDETSELRVIPAESLRTVITDIEDWNGARVQGNICQGPRGSTEMTLYPSGRGFMDESALATLAGDVTGYDDGVYYMEMWPQYPCFPSPRSVKECGETEIDPLYCFDLEFHNHLIWLFGMFEETFILSSGQGFFLMNGNGEVFSSSGRQRDRMRLGLNNIVFGTAGFDTGLMPEGHIILRFDGLQEDHHIPQLASLIETCAEGTLSGTLLLDWSRDLEPAALSRFSLSLDRPEFLLQVSDSASAAAGLDGAHLVFPEDGIAAIEHAGREYRQDNLHLRVPRTHHNSYLYGMAFSIPNRPDSYIALAFPGTRRMWSGSGADDTVAAQLLNNCLKDGHASCQVWSYHRLEDSYTRLGDFRISIL